MMPSYIPHHDYYKETVRFWSDRMRENRHVNENEECEEGNGSIV